MAQALSIAPTAKAAGTAFDEVGATRRWLKHEQREGTLLAEETLWREAHDTYVRASRVCGDGESPPSWACVASEIVFKNPGIPLNLRAAGTLACQFLTEHPELDRFAQARKMQEIAQDHDVEAWKLRALLSPGGGYPWMFSRKLWSAQVIAENLEAILAPFDWKPGAEPRCEWIVQDALTLDVADFLILLRRLSPPGSPLDRMLAAIGSRVKSLIDEGKDPCIVESHSFVGALAGHGLSSEEIAGWHSRLLALRDMVAMFQSFQLYRRAESLVATAQGIRLSSPFEAIGLLAKAGNIYKRLCVAQMYPEPLLERYHRINRWTEDVRREAGLPDARCEHVLLVSTMNSPGDLQRLLLSIGEELKSFGYGGKVHVIVSDESVGDLQTETEKIVKEARKSGLSVSHWPLNKRDDFLKQLNQEVFPDGGFDVRSLAGTKRPGEKGIPYGRLRNFLRLAALHEIGKEGLDEPISTWLDQDNELGALVLTRGGNLSKRHVFNYFDQKSSIFDDPNVQVGGGGYTNDALEGVEKFWVAWGILHSALGFVHNHSPQGPSVLPSAADITRFRPWDQADTLERLPREGEDLETMSDQVLLLLKTLLGTFRGKYDNQVQVYHPWSYGYVSEDGESLVEEIRAFAGMPGGNTSFRTEILSSPLPFLTVGGRGEDIFHLWQIEGTHGAGSVFLTHSPVLHTRNVRRGRGNLMAEIIDSFNGRIFREPPYLWAALDQFVSCGDPERAVPGQPVEAATSARIEGLRQEAKASISAVSSFAAELEPHLDEQDPMWALGKAKNSAACVELISEIRTVVEDFKDLERHHKEADEKLLGLEDVKELTADFLKAFPHWETTVEHVGGPRGKQAGEQVSRLAGLGPSEGYGDPLREQAGSSPAFAVASAIAEPSALLEPMAEPVWREVVISSLLVFRRFEQGFAQRDDLLEWQRRVSRLKSIYDHYAGHHPDIPEFAWTELFREALLTPNSAPYLAVSEMLQEPFSLLNTQDKGRTTDELARRFHVESHLLEQALTPAAA